MMTEQEFLRVFGPLRPHAVRVAKRMRCSLDEAEDVAQDAMVRAFNHRDDYDPMRPASAWITTIVQHLVIDYRRRQAHRDRVVEEVGARLPVKVVDPARNLDMIVVMAATEKLVAEGRPDVAAALMQSQRISFNEIAVELGVSLAEAKRLSVKGVRRLRGMTLEIRAMALSEEPRPTRRAKPVPEGQCAMAL
jgi:RNA polymerase sigma-70 factor (ECF subfamily)